MPRVGIYPFYSNLTYNKNFKPASLSTNLCSLAVWELNYRGNLVTFLTKPSTPNPGFAMPSYGKRLLRRTELSAELIKLFAKQRTFSYQQLANMIGIKKSDVFYFVGVTRAKGKKSPEPTDIKVNKFSKIISWFEQLDPNQPFFTLEQRKLIEKLHETFVRDDKSEVYETLAGGFRIEKKDVLHHLKSLFGYYLCYRIRGTTGLISVFALSIELSADGNHCQWKAKFLEAEGEAKPGKKFDREIMNTHEVSGYATLEGTALTCIGRRSDTNEMHLINIMTNDPNAHIFRALYSSFSRREAIGRSVWIVRQPDINSNNFYKLDDKLNDFYHDRLTADERIDLVELKKSLTVNNKEFKMGAKLFHAPG